MIKMQENIFGGTYAVNFEGWKECIKQGIDIAGVALTYGKDKYSEFFKRCYTECSKEEIALMEQMMHSNRIFYTNRKIDLNVNTFVNSLALPSVFRKLSDEDYVDFLDSVAKHMIKATETDVEYTEMTIDTLEAFMEIFEGTPIVYIDDIINSDFPVTLLFRQ